MQSILAITGSTETTILQWLFVAVAFFLVCCVWHHLVWRKIVRAHPKEGEIEQCRVYASRIGSHEGVIISEPDIVHFRWRRERQPGWSRREDFVIRDSLEQEVLRIRRVGRFPARFRLLESGKSVGQITMRSILRNKYTVELLDRSTWTLRMPLFTVFFRGESAAGDRMWMILGPGTKLQWMLWLEPAADTMPLLSSIAFIHRRWYL